MKISVEGKCLCTACISKIRIFIQHTKCVHGCHIYLSPLSVIYYSTVLRTLNMVDCWVRLIANIAWLLTLDCIPCIMVLFAAVCKSGPNINHFTTVTSCKYHKHMHRRKDWRYQTYYLCYMWSIKWPNGQKTSHTHNDYEFQSIFLFLKQNLF